MPEKKTIERAKEDARAGKSPSTQAGEFVRQEMHHIREGKHGAKNTKQAIAIGMSEARRAGVKIPRRGKSASSSRKRSSASSSRKRSSESSAKRSRASKKALKRQPRKAASRRSLSRQARAAAHRRSRADRSRAAKKAARTRKRERARQGKQKSA